ncbi:CRISPR-associated endonuclease Cas1 1 [Betaproteobacteria bacterium]|nr:CRISPR-associated endonuclease Cas1 1 [Betaproteobacteria bacterium]GHT95145.1 CRISPR-associated endonuclease Cas1 1 [Betaproteobacteria bacterium]GHU00529.1 CRISPR-associated endonuclease Cas1 1 [Betaproteobacteria bacterium]GHU20574.1 CRISPR-associated endonuclease Cas1 1 [Betaproteobacteria bacterium]GHU25829.1 CRISPR-associated endonuclease Cas1 1 [Betaproteobacteria bacterium]
MSSLYVDRKDVELKADGEALVFYEGGQRIGTVPLHPLSRIFLRGDIKLTSSLLGKLGEHGIGVIVLSGRKAQPSLLLGRPHNDAARRIAQYRLSLDTDYCLKFSRAIVAAKLGGQLELIRERRDVSPMHRYPLIHCERQIEGMMQQIDLQGSISSLRGLEGAAAASYFTALAEILPESLNFHDRNRRPPRDPVNAVLSLTYTLLHSEATLALYGAGLDPFIGFYHALDFGRESLACDVMEALRPQADRFVLALFRLETLKSADFSTTNAGCLLGKAGRSRYYAAYETHAEHFRRELEHAVQDIAAAIGAMPATATREAHHE